MSHVDLTASLTSVVGMVQNVGYVASGWCHFNGTVCVHVCVFLSPQFFPKFFLPCGICPNLILPSLSWSSFLQYYAVQSVIHFLVFCCVFIILCDNWMLEISVNSKIIVCCKFKFQHLMAVNVTMCHHVGQLYAFSSLLSMCAQI